MAMEGETERNRLILSALCKHFSIDPAGFSVQEFENIDIKSLYALVLQHMGKLPLDEENEILKWIAFANSFPTSGPCSSAIEDINEKLNEKSVLIGDGLQPSEADVIVFSVVNHCLNALSEADKKRIVNVMRWIDYIQHREGLGELFPLIQVEKSNFDPNSIPKKDTKVKVEEKKNVQEKDQVGKEAEVSVCVLKIQVGIIIKVWKHPSADSLLVEEIDLGENVPRQVVSGLAKYYAPEELLNRKVLVITNVKPGKLRDVMSSGLVLCASNQDHTTVEPLVPPEGVKIGELVSFEGLTGKPEEVLNPKKKQLEKITPHLYTDEKGVATYKGITFMTSAGLCTSSLPNASIR